MENIENLTKLVTKNASEIYENPALGTQDSDLCDFVKLLEEADFSRVFDRRKVGWKFGKPVNFEYVTVPNQRRLDASLEIFFLQRYRCPLGGIYQGPNMYSHSIMSSATVICRASRPKGRWFIDDLGVTGGQKGSDLDDLACQPAKREVI